MSSPYVNAGPAWGTAMEPSSDPVERNDSIDEWMAFHKGLPNEYSLRLALLKRELGKELVEYSLRRKEGLIPQREDLGWGFESSSRRNRARDINNRTQGLPFFEVKWKEGFTGRGGMSLHRILSRTVVDLAGSGSQRRTRAHRSTCGSKE